MSTPARLTFATIASTEFNDVAPLILNGKCTLSRQAANFDSNYQNAKTGPDGDIDVFYFPPIPETVFRFDASDLMPASIGSDAEWKQFTAWITGQDDATTLANIDNAWPAS